MRKTFALLTKILLPLSLIALTGCHGSKGLPSFEVPETFDESKEYNITFWAKNDTNITQANIYNQAIKDFEELYPNIHVNMRLYTDYGRIYNDVITNISTRTTPNVCITYPDHIATYLTGANTVVPLDALMADSRYGLNGSALKYEAPGDIVPKFAEEVKLSGISYAIPYMRSTEACYVNKTMVEKLGYTLPDTLTWDFVWEVSEKAMEKDSDGSFKINGQKVMIPFIYKSTDNMMIQMMRQKNAGFSDEEGNILLFNDTAKELLEEIAVHAGTGSFSTFKISSYPGNFLNAGQCIFAIDSTAGATWMGPHATNHDISEDKLVDFDMVVTRIPQFDTANPVMISQGPSICVFNKEDPEEVLASWLFAQYMITSDIQIAYSSTEGYIPVTEKALNDPSYLDYLSKEGIDNDLHYAPKIKASKLLIDNIDRTFITPVFNGSASLRDAAGQLIESTTKSMRRKETVDDAYFTRLYKDTRSLYHLDSVSKANTDGGEKKEFAPLPLTSKILLFALLFTWVGIGAFYLRGVIKKAYGKNNHK